MRNIFTYNLRKNLFKYSKNSFFCLFIVSSLSSLELQARSWLVYMYVQTDDDRAQQIARDIETIMSARAHQVRLVLDVEMKDSLIRMTFEAGRCVRQTIKKDVDIQHHLMSGCMSAFSCYAGEKTMIIFSGHATGILQPSFDEKKQMWCFEPDTGNSPFHAACARRYADFYATVTEVLDHKSLLVTKDKAPALSLIDLTRVLACVKEDFLQGNTIDIIGFDACYMAMLEIVYELQPYATYCVASEGAQDNDGWDYSPLAYLDDASAHELARSFVFYFEMMQRKKGADRFSLSAFHVPSVHAVAHSLDMLCDDLMMLPKDAAFILLSNARLNTSRFSSISMYADLREFLVQLCKEVDSLPQTQQLERIKSDIEQVLFHLRYMVLAQVNGPQIPMHGCSLYFPTAHIDSSYVCSFVTTHSWSALLRFIQG